MKTTMRSVSLAILGFVVGAVGSGPAHGALITGSDIVALPNGIVPSGNGQLDLRLFTSSAAGNGTFDDANTSLPGGANSFTESYVTTVADLLAFYASHFPNPVNEIVLFLDLNESNATEEQNNTLKKLDIILNPTSIQGNPNAAGDVSSAVQNAIDQVYTGGTLLTQLLPEPAGNLPVVNQGAGFADYAIYTGVNPQSLIPTDVLLFNISMELLSNGGEEIFITAVPEPATVFAGGLLLLPLGTIVLRMLRRRTS